MIPVLLAVGTVLGVVATGVSFVLAKRVVTATPHPRLLAAEFSDHEVSLPEDAKTTAAGEYLLQLPEENGAVVRVGRVLRIEDGRVHRAVEAVATSRFGEARGYWSAHRYASPAEVGDYLTVAVPLADGERREAWLFPGDRSHWVVHVQGIRTSRGVTLRTVAAARDAGVTSLTIAYRGAGDGPPSKAATLGAREWTELRDAIAYARAEGAQRVTVVAWSMGAGLVLELLKRDRSAVDDLVLICPVSSWPATIEYGARQAGLPRQAAVLAGALMRSRVGAKLLGMPPRTPNAYHTD